MSQLILAAAAEENFFQRLIDAAIPIGKYQLHYLELIGVLIGVVSAWFGMKRRVWAWPVGITANIMLFFVYIGATIGAGERIPLFGQAGRQIFFIATSIYGWWRWSQLQKQTGSKDAPAITPRWMTSRERAVVIARYAEGLPSAEVATLLGRSEAWVRKTASRTLAKLRRSPDLAPDTERRSLA